MEELSALPSFGIFLAWLDEQREGSISNLCQPGLPQDRLYWEGGRMSLLEEIREITLDNAISSKHDEFTDRGAPARRTGKKKEAV